MPKLVWLNGVTMPLESATTSVADHAHLYGDGLFEGIRIYAGKIFKLDEHIERLFHGCLFFGYEMTMGPADIKAQIVATCHEAQIMDGYVRLNVTRGTGLGLDPKNIDRTPNVMVMVSTLALYPPEAYATGLDVVTTSIRVIAPDALDPRLKCIGRYAPNILAKAEANRMGAGEALMLNPQGYVAECTGDNIFIIRNNVIRTPHPSCGLLQGITRDTAISLAKEHNYLVDECNLTLYDVISADEAFLTGTAAEIIPMVTLDKRPIGDGRPGPITRKMMDLYRQETQNGTSF